MQVTKQIQDAILAYLSENRLSRRALAESLHVSHTTVSRWLTGQQRISPEDWLKLRPMLFPHLPAALRTVDNPGAQVPVISLSAAGKYAPAIDTAEAFLAGFIKDAADMVDAAPGVLPLQVVGEDAAALTTLAAHGAILNVDTTKKPAAGDLVVVKISSQPRPVVRYYQRAGTTITLSPISDEAEVVQIDMAADAARLAWCCPVAKVEIIPPRRNGDK